MADAPPPVPSRASRKFPSSSSNEPPPPPLSGMPGSSGPPPPASLSSNPLTPVGAGSFSSTTSSSADSSAPKWYYKTMSRVEAEQLLCKNVLDGSFLVRDSESIEGASVLSLLFEGRIHHYRLMRTSNGITLEGEPTIHASLVAMIEYCVKRKNLVFPPTNPIELDAAPLPSLPTDPSKEQEETELDTEPCYTIDLFSRANISKSSSRKDDVHNNIDKYIQEKVCTDSDSVKAGHVPEHLKNLILSMSSDLQDELDRFTTRLQRLSSVFSLASREHGLPHASALGAPPQPADRSLDALVARLQFARDLLGETRTVSEKLLKDVSCEHTSVLISEPSLGSSGDTRVFEVKKIDKMVGKEVKTKTAISVCKGAGTIAMGKASDHDDEKTYTHSQVKQLIKSRSDPTRLGILLEGKGRRNYQFADSQMREEFCQLVQMLKTQEVPRGTSHVERLSLFIGTFNMGEAAPPRELSNWFLCQGDGKVLPKDHSIKHDLYVVGTQESALSEKDWQAVVKRHIGDNYSLLESVQLWQIRLVVFAKKDLVHKISHIEKASVATGIANALGNKGAVGVSFFVGTTSFCFINCHLTAGAEKFSKRNANYFDIVTKLQLGQRRLSLFDVTNQFHHTFWLGDMNYRVNIPIQTVLEYAKARNFPLLRQADQLSKQRTNGTVFFGFEEGELNFAPTYRYERGTREVYKWEKHKATHVKINVPSYCDRILWKSFRNTYIKQTSYGCPLDIMTSDHSPVFGTFDISYSNQFVAKALVSDHGCRIHIASIAAQVQTNSKTNFYLTFYGSFIEETRTAPNPRFENEQRSKMQGYMTPVWEDAEVPDLKPMLPDMAYLEAEHLLVAVRSQDNDEAYGEGCISLMYLFGDTPIPFACTLTHRGVYAGELRGSLHIVNSVGQTRIDNTITVSANDDEDSVEDASVLSRQSTQRKTLFEPATTVPLPPREDDSAFSRQVTQRRPLSEAPPPILPKKPSSVRLAPAVPLTSPPVGIGGLTPSSAPRGKPTSVPAWLSSLGLPEYTQNFISQGFDDMEFLGDIEEADLGAIGVIEPAHRRRIMEGLARLKESDA